MLSSSLAKSTVALLVTAQMVAGSGITGVLDGSVQRMACYDESEALYCYNGGNDIPQNVDLDDVFFIAAYLRAYGRETRNGRLLTMTQADAANCGEWSLFARGTALAVAKKIDMSFDSSVLFEDVATTIDGGGGTVRTNGIHRCREDGGSLGVRVNATHPSYKLPTYVDAGYKAAGIIVKIVANL